MKASHQNFKTINSVSEYHALLQLDKPEHPLMSIVNFSKVKYTNPGPEITLVMNLYCITIKQGADCVLRYGPLHYDFNEGVMLFIKPGQVISVQHTSENAKEGYMLLIHPDFLGSFPLGLKIKRYGYFEYAIHEALFLSDREKIHMNTIMAGIEIEYHTNIDMFSQEAIVTFTELLLVYANRYFNRQFITRKSKNEQLLMQVEKLLDDYYTAGQVIKNGLPTVQYLGEKLNLSPNYLSDMLRVTTGKSAQSHIQHKILEEAKLLLSTSKLSVSEIAYQLGFERPQSLSKLFKAKVAISPLEYRASFN
ncbi:transcriptional regulator, AraC family [Mucilaginibacter lappiensis]|uniref:AraC-like DNA-binding protein n=1 Tax=Mucilaginibacter lappiensis TaxID=354630 RepID=A0ABR6PDD0_9SPHI|nr:helix-turn-helix domain-containing protein [Mucilaginibacter lappiensis]MBB6107777.1 AraC-like DNA-binding protein [Mucilaginibacter lappiensis]SIP97508.1 transcriptional regulator, AraC family [Mucilaginibacter lappiensis]